MKGTSYIIDIVDSVLRHWSVKVGNESIRNVLCSNPSYPSIKSLHDTLAYFGLESNVYQADFEHIVDKPHSVIHTTKYDGRFYYVNDISADSVTLYDGTLRVVSKEDFLSLWDGVVLLVESKHEVLLPKSRTSFKLCGFVLLVAVLLAAQVLILKSQPYAVLHLLLDAVGIALCCLLYFQHQFSLSSFPFCHIGQRFDCSAVSAANPFQRFLPFSLPVLGFYFFLFDWLLLLLQRHDNYYSLFASCLAAAFMLSLVAYQLFAVRKYCLYCMCVSVVVFLKPFFINPGGNNGVIAFLFVLSSALVTLAVVVLINVCGNSVKTAKDSRVKLLTLKRIPGMFNMLLNRQPQKQVVSAHALQFGNENAKITLDTVVSLNCRHCRETVKQVCTLMERWPNLFRWRVYLDGISDSGSDKILNLRQLQVVNLYQSDSYQAFLALKEWRFKKLSHDVSSCAKARYVELLVDIRQMEVEHYPTILFNGRLFPSEYSLADVDVLISDWQL